MPGDNTEEFNDTSKRIQGTHVRIPDALKARIDAECEYLGVTRTAWIIMTCDKELRNSYKERALNPETPQQMYHASRLEADNS